MGLYRRKGSPLWQMCFFVNGKKVRMSTKTTSKKSAQKIFEKVKGQVAEGSFKLEPDFQMPFEKLVEEFIEKHSKVEKSDYRLDVTLSKPLIEYFGQKPIDKITLLDLKEWRKWRVEHVTRRGTKIKKSSVNREMALLKTLFNMAVEWNWLSESPARKLKPLRGESKRMRFLTNAEISRLLSCAVDYLKPIIIAAISTGMRRGELLNLKWKEVDLEHGFIRVLKSKNHESRDIPVNRFLSEQFESLEQSREPGGYVFCHENGDKRFGIGPMFRKACAEAGIEDFRFHDLRHTAASLFASRGCDIVTLQHLLGHKSILMTQRYAHLLPDRHEKTRRIMEEFWVLLGDTINDTQVLSEVEKAG